MAATPLSNIRNLAIDSTYGNVVSGNTLSGTLPDGITYGTITQAASKTATLSGLAFNSGAALNFTNGTVSNLALTGGTNSVAGSIITGTIGNTVTFNGTVAQTGAATATLANTSWNASSTVNFTNATTISNFTLATGNSNNIAAGVLSGTLPDTLTYGTITQSAAKTATLSGLAFNASSNVNFANATITNAAFTNIRIGQANSQRILDGKAYQPGIASNLGGTITTITLDFTSSVAWAFRVNAFGATATTGHSCQAEWVFVKPSGSTTTVRTNYKGEWTSNSTVLSAPTFSTTGSTIIISQQTASTADGNVIWNICTELIPLAGSPTAPTFS